MVESVIGVIDNAITKKLTTGRYNIVFTTNRVIIAQAQSFGKMMKISAMGTAISAPLGLGIGPGARIPGDMIRNNAFESAREMEKMTPKRILESEKSNFSINYSEINRIEIKRGSFWRSTKIRIFKDEKKYYEYVLANRGFSQRVSQNLFQKYKKIIKRSFKGKLIEK